VVIKAGGDGEAVATGAREIAASRPGIKVTTLGQTQRLISSSLTAVDLGGLTVLELGFAVLMVAGVAGLVLGLGLAERRRSFSMLLIVGVGALCGTVIGFAVAEVLVKVLSGVFDPPP